MQQAFDGAFESAQKLHELTDLTLEITMPHMRFLHYAEVGGGLPPHLDLVRTDTWWSSSMLSVVRFLKMY